MPIVDVDISYSLIAHSRGGLGAPIVQKKMVVARIGVRGVNMISYIFCFWALHSLVLRLRVGHASG